MLTDTIEKLADKAASIFEKVGNLQIDIYRETFEADAYDGQTKVETKLNRHPIAAVLTARNARTDEGGKYQSYVQTVIQFACRQDKQRIYLKLTDKIKTVENDVHETREFSIDSIGFMRDALDTVFEVTGTWDLRAADRLNGA